jgi:hypothetical protein
MIRLFPVQTFILLKKISLLAVIALTLAVGVNSCTETDYKDPSQLSDSPGNVAIAWADMTLYTLRFSGFNTPTYASRSLGYIGLTMYETIVAGSEQNKSLNGQLNGLTLPEPEAGAKYHWVLALNAGQHFIIKKLYPAPGNSHRYVHEKIDSLHGALLREYSANIEPAVVELSVAFGTSIAQAVYDWSVNDGGDKGYTRNFDPTFIFPKGESYWIPPVRGQTISPYPLHPHWGKNRTFVIANGLLPVPPIVPFSKDPGSDYYKLYDAVYQKDPTLKAPEREIAAWWADDPTETPSPPGHSYYLTTLALKKLDADLITAAEAYAHVGMAVADAFINCWKAKYTYFNERPSTFVKSHVDEGWVQFWPEPPFPAFPSGHSIQSSAAATVLTALFGEPFAFTDNMYEGHRRYDDIRFTDLTYSARSYKSFREAANECAYSRFLGGIHTMQDNNTGIQEGIKIGGNVAALKWRK